MATERPGSSPLNYEKRPVSSMAGCGAELFDAGGQVRQWSGLAQFHDTKAGAVTTTTDTSPWQVRTGLIAPIVVPSGHVFNDGPGPTVFRIAPMVCSRFQADSK